MRRAKNRLQKLIITITIIAIIGIAIWYMFPATTFIETGLPNGAQWTISYGQAIGSYSLATTNSKSITVYLFRFNGAYTYETGDAIASSEYCSTTLSFGVFNAGTTIHLPYTCYNSSV